MHISTTLGHGGSPICLVVVGVCLITMRPLMKTSYVCPNFHLKLLCHMCQCGRMAIIITWKMRNVIATQPMIVELLVFSSWGPTPLHETIM
jgi:hypothetical protein